jgi:S-formylglutathione hydrolase FrmB
MSQRNWRSIAPERLISSSRRLMDRWRDRPTLDQRAQRLTIRSRALGVRKDCYVYLPPVASGTPLPALYIFRGHEREWINPQQDQSRGGTTIIDEYEDLLRQGAVGPMALVFPGVSSDDNTVPGLLVNFLHPELTSARGVGAGCFQDYFLSEVIPQVERRFPIDSQRRGTHGFSLGGFMAIKIAMQCPDLFRVAGAYDGLFFWDDPDDPHCVAATDRTFHNPMFDPAFGAGKRRNRRYAALHNPLNLLRNGKATDVHKLAWIIEYGPRASEPGDSNYFRGERFCELLMTHGIRNLGRGEVADGTHSWRFADDQLRHVLPLYWRELTRS